MRFVLLGFILSLLIPSFSLSEKAEIKEYKIVKGDTLWDISGKELRDSFLWPKVWQENPQIANPDRIYPGQTIKIPLRLLEKETQEAPEAAPAAQQPPSPVKEEEVAKKEPVPAPMEPLVEKDLLMSSGYITDSMHSVGKITGSPDNHILYGNNDLVYVATDEPAKIGDEFYIIRRGDAVYHPATGKKLGYIVLVLGVGKVDHFEFGQTMMKITRFFDDIHNGDLLGTYHEMTPPLVPPLSTGNYRTPDISGYVVASKHMMNANHDIVFIDKGSADGIEVGDMLRTVEVGTHEVASGKIQVINSGEKTSTAIIRDNFRARAIKVGNLVMGVE
jgi:LysM repeat protein